MIVCICHRVSDRDIAREVSAGCPSFEALQATLKVGTGCGCCKDHARAAFEQSAGKATLASGSTLGAGQACGARVIPLLRQLQPGQTAAPA